MVRLLLVLAVVLAATTAALPARAAGAISYSAAENVYGWCSGYASARSASCAEKYCRQTGGSDCRPVVSCPSGWGAIALAPKGIGGFAAMCGLSSATGSRMVALAACAAAANALCRLDVTFDGRGNASPARSNEDFVRTWYTQLLLQLGRMYDGEADGEAGRVTAAAVRDFQTRIGVEADGRITDDLLARLRDANGGEQEFVAGLRDSVLPPFAGEVSDLMYAYAANPVATRTFAEDLMARTADDRLLALTTLLRMHEVKCTSPVGENLLSPPSDPVETWVIHCSERSVTMMRGNGSTTIVGK